MEEIPLIFFNRPFTMNTYNFQKIAYCIVLGEKWRYETYCQYNSMSAVRESGANCNMGKLQQMQ